MFNITLLFSDFWISTLGNICTFINPGTINGSICFFISISLLILVFISTFENKIPSYSNYSVTLNSNLIDTASKLAITYSKMEICRLTINRIIFVNLGNHRIDKEDVFFSLKISLLENVEIFQARLLYVKNQLNNFVITHDGKDVLITFNYLSRNEGGVIELVHAATNEYIIVSGGVRGRGIFKFNTYSNNVRLTSSTVDTFALLLLFALISSIFFVVFIVHLGNINSLGCFDHSLIIYSLIIILITISLIRYIYFRTVTENVYKNLKEYINIIGRPWTA